MLKKINVSDIYSHTYTKTKISSDDDLPLERTIKMHDIIILSMLVFNKKHNHYYQNVHTNNIMLCYSRIEFSEGILINKTSFI